MNSGPALDTCHRSLPHKRCGFTLLELLVVMGIIGLLAALLFPTLGAVRRAASRMKTRVQFSQWVAAIESFRSEYGYYPVLDASQLVNGGVNAVDHPFYDLLAARRRDGTALSAASPAALQNRKLITFLQFSENDLNPAGFIRDASDNTAIAVLVDRDLDGLIRVGSDLDSWPAVNGLAPSEEDFPAGGIRAGVIFYAPAPAATQDNPEFVYSWK